MTQPTEKKDCFGYKMGKCTVLTDLVCSQGKCSFYKTREQYNRDREKAEKRNKEVT